MQQTTGNLFDPAPDEPAIPLNPTVPAPAVKRLSRQCVAILDRLKQGRATNRELVGIALKYTGRLSEIRQAGYDVRCVEHDQETGLTRYALFGSDGRELTRPNGGQND